MAKIIDLDLVKAGVSSEELPGETVPSGNDAICGIDTVCNGTNDGGCTIDYVCGGPDGPCLLLDYACGPTPAPNPV